MPLGLALVAALAALGVAVACVKTTPTPPGAAGPSPTSPAPARATATPAVETPVLTVAPEPAATPTPALIATATPTLAAIPTPQANATAKPTTVVTGPPPTPSQVWSLPGNPGNIGSHLLYLIMAREMGLDKTNKELARVLALMDQKGGADVAIVFKRILSEAEVSALEREFGLKFFRVGGRVDTTSRVYSVIVPWEQIVPVARLPQVEVIDTSAWPPTVPAK